MGAKYKRMDRVERKRIRNRKRRINIRNKRKEHLTKTFAVSKELHDKKKELSSTLRRLEETELKAVSLTKQSQKIRHSVSANISSVCRCVFTKPTASSRLQSSKKCAACILGEDLLRCKVTMLDRGSLNVCSSKHCELGSGSFGKCTKMVPSSTEVAVKETTLSEYSRKNIMYEAMVMTEVCCGHQNLPLFIGVYDHEEYQKPLLVMKYYSVAGEPCTFHHYLKKQRSNLSLRMQDWVCMLMGICNGLGAIHSKGYLHNDLKSNNIVLNNCMPYSNYTPHVWPIIIDFGKARPIDSPQKYKLSRVEQEQHLKAYPHLAPDLVHGTNSQSILTDVYSLGHIIGKVAYVASNEDLKSSSKLCTKENIANRPSIEFIHADLCALK